MVYCIKEEVYEEEGEQEGQDKRRNIDGGAGRLRRGTEVRHCV